MKTLNSLDDLHDLNVTLSARDWVWLCDMLAEITRQIDFEQMTKYDHDRVLGCLDALEAGQ